MEALGWKRRLEELRGEVGLVAGGNVDLGSLSAVLAAAYGDRPAISAPAWPPGLEGKPERSYRELDDAVARLAAAHDALGNHRAARVAIACANRIDVLLHVLALVRAGAIPVPVNARLKPAEFHEVIVASRASAIIMDGDLVASLVPAAIPVPTAPAASAPGERGRVRLPMAGDAPLIGERLVWSGVGAPPKGVRGVDLAAWLRAHPDARLAPTKRIYPSETALLLCTSGTTGHPKVAALTSEGLLRVPGRGLVAPVGRDKGLRAGRDVVICALPLAHAMGIGTFLGALCAGTKVIHLERFDAGAILARIESERPNVFIGVPTMYADLEAEGAAHRDLSSIQLWVSAADVMPPERARRFQKYGAAGSLLGKRLGTALFADIYGMVELSGAAAMRLYPASPLRDVEVPAVAFTLPGFEVRVVGEDGKALSWGATGSLQLRGPSVLQHYEGAPGADPLPEGWFPTGDLARVWPGGFFAFVGRSKDRLKVSGFSVFPAEVETILREHPDVAEVVLVGVPDDRTGEKPVALVIPKGEAFDAEGFVTWAAGKVAAYRRPRAAVVVKALPRGNHGKIDRAAATRIAVERLGSGATP
jgi:acyl-CoA synthetase (AMP-forming)/AMP-acid ligase II